jgi:signal transduction histidine kinase
MQDISLHILDIAENSIRAGATKILIDILEKPVDDVLRVIIDDNGIGMDDETCRNAQDPFYTSKQGKRVGLGIPLLAQAAREGGGKFKMDSRPEQGTRIEASFQFSHPDRKPLGDVSGTVQLLKLSHPEIDFKYTHRKE